MAEVRSEEGKRAKIEYISRYNKEKYDNITLMLPKGSKERIKAAAKEKGLSMSAFAMMAIDDYLNRNT